MLSLIGYISSTEHIVQAPEVIERIYSVATLAPAICYFLVAMILILWYPLNKRRIAENAEKIKALRAKA